MPAPCGYCARSGKWPDTGWSDTSAAICGDLRRMPAVGVLGGGFWLASFLIAYRLVRFFRSTEGIGTLLSRKLLSMVLRSFVSILLLSNTIAALSNFFLAKDFDHLAAAPISLWALYRARLFETALHASWMVALLLVPIIAAYGAAFEAGATDARFT